MPGKEVWALFSESPRTCLPHTKPTLELSALEKVVTGY